MLVRKIDLVNNSRHVSIQNIVCYCVMNLKCSYGEWTFWEENITYKFIDMKSKIFFILALVALITLMRACSPGHYPNHKTEDFPFVTLKQVKTNIDVLEGQPVIIQGKVVRTFYLGLFNGGIYRIEDKQGERLTIATRREVSPAKGEEVILIVVPKVLIRIEGSLGIISVEYKRLYFEPTPQIEEDSYRDDAFSYTESI